METFTTQFTFQNIKAIVGLYRGNDATFKAATQTYQNEIATALAAAAESWNALIQQKTFAAENLSLDITGDNIEPVCSLHTTLSRLSETPKQT